MSTEHTCFAPFCCTRFKLWPDYDSFRFFDWIQKDKEQLSKNWLRIGLMRRWLY